MNRLRILHQTRYVYAKPVCFGRHRFIVRPREGHDIHIESHELTTDPPAEIHWHRDIFGNSVAMAQFSMAADFLLIKNDVIISRRPTSTRGGFLEIRPVAYPLLYSELEIAVVHGYRSAVFNEEIAAISEWVWTRFHPGNDSDAVDLVQAMTDWIYRSIRYRRREDRGVQTPLETLRLRTGSCRDMATLLLEGIRSLGFAARFASGYLDSQAAACGQAATHAWVEVYFPEHGWFGVDPTIGKGVSCKHIVTGVSSHPRGVMPVSGSYSGPPEAFIEMTVSVHIDKDPAVTMTQTA